jgi:hypothetical protein
MIAAVLVGLAAVGAAGYYFVVIKGGKTPPVVPTPTPEVTSGEKETWPQSITVASLIPPGAHVALKGQGGAAPLKAEVTSEGAKISLADAAVTK